MKGTRGRFLLEERLGRGSNLVDAEGNCSQAVEKHFSLYLLMTSGESGVSLVMSRLVKSCLDKCGWPEVTVGRAFDSVLTSSWTVMVLENR